MGDHEDYLNIWKYEKNIYTLVRLEKCLDLAVIYTHINT